MLLYRLCIGSGYFSETLKHYSLMFWRFCFSVTTAPRPPIGRFEPPHYRLQRKKGGVKAERVKTGPVCSQRRPAGESKACFAEPPQSKRRIPLRRKPAKAPVLASPNSDPAKATCGWFWVPFATKSTTNPQNGQISAVVLTIRLFFGSVRPVEVFEWTAGGIVERGFGFQSITLSGNASHFLKR